MPLQSLMMREDEIIERIASVLGCDPESARREYFETVCAGTLPIEAAPFSTRWVAYAGGREQTLAELNTGRKEIPLCIWRRTQLEGLPWPGDDRRGRRVDVEVLWPKRRKRGSKQDKRNAEIQAMLASGLRPGKTIPWVTFIRQLAKRCGTTPGQRGFSTKQIGRLIAKIESAG